MMLNEAYSLITRLENDVAAGQVSSLAQDGRVDLAVDGNGTKQ